MNEHRWISSYWLDEKKKGKGNSGVQQVGQGELDRYQVIH